VDRFRRRAGDPEAAFGEVYADLVEMRGRHVGPYASPLGSVAPTGRDIAIWVVADDLGLLRQLDAARLNGLRGTRQRRGPPHRLSDAVFAPRLRRLTRFARTRH
jgi:hypothetical protein